MGRSLPKIPATSLPRRGLSREGASMYLGVEFGSIGSSRDALKEGRHE
jgi:hypothetical protein